VPLNIEVAMEHPKAGMKLRIVLCVAAMAAALGLSAIGLGHPGAAAAAKASAAAPTTTSTTTAGSPDTSLPPIKHVFVIVLENESASRTFPAAGPAPAPYLADTMVSEGAFLPNYYGTGHASNDNYIAMISGQAPNSENSDDCLVFGDFDETANTGAPYDEQDGLGCVYPSNIQNIASQLDAAGLSWRDYNEDMGNDPSREASTCGHPAVGSIDHTQTEASGDAYATRHDPFVYFHDIIDNPTLCDSHVVNLNELATDLQSSATTPNYVFITPNLCHDGHDATCKTAGENGGFAGINDFLSKYVPMITGSPAFQQQDGLLITTFDEAATSDASSCCGEIPGPGAARPGETGSGGGRVGAVLISPCIAPGTVSDVAYNHYSMLGSVENLFGLGHLGYAGLPDQSYFGPDVYTQKCDAAPAVGLSASSPGASRPASASPVTLSFGPAATGVTYALQVRQLHARSATAWRTLETGATTTRFRFGARAASTYEFRVQATNALGISSAWRTETVVIPTYAKAAGAKLGGDWTYRADSGASRGHAEFGATGATYTYAYVGGALSVLVTKLPAGGRVRVSFDGTSRVLSVHAARREVRQTIFSVRARPGRHRLVLTVLSGELPVEALSVSDLG
jgi:hypothetical protein